MLINFRVENFLSFNNNSTFSMTLGKTKSHEKNIIRSNKINLLKFAAIYGANAAGKSNFIKAISFSQNMIINGIGVTSDLYNKNCAENKQRKSKFEFEIKIDQTIYSYGFSINISENKFYEEWLYDITNEERQIYIRDQNIDFNFNYLDLDRDSIKRIEVYAQDIRDTQLVLFSLNKDKNDISSKKGDKIFKKIFEWFKFTLEVISPNDSASDFGITYQNEEFLSLLGKFLEYNDTGIVEANLEKTEGRMKDLPIEMEKDLKSDILANLLKIRNEDENNKHYTTTLRTPGNVYHFTLIDDKLQTSEIRFLHKNCDLKYSLYEESDGTVRLVELFSILFSKQEKVFIIDELDRSMHPLLTYNFVQSFLDKNIDSQLIVTTHEDRLLDLDLLRRDEIWFVKKDNDGNSNLYSLEEFKERFDKNIMNAYLDGRYGGTPKILNLFSALKDTTEIKQ